MKNLKVREGEPRDRDDIIEIDQVAQLEDGRISFVDRVLASTYEKCLIAELAGRVVAYGVLEYTFFGAGFISLIYVEESQRRKGIGRSLMQALDEACTTPKLFTSTNESNKPMRALLETLGYVRSGIIYNLDPGDPELVYFHAPRWRAAQQTTLHSRTTWLRQNAR